MKFQNHYLSRCRVIPLKSFGSHIQIRVKVVFICSGEVSWFRVKGMLCKVNVFNNGEVNEVITNYFSKGARRGYC